MTEDDDMDFHLDKWAYYHKHNVYGKKSARISDDGAHIVTSNGKIVCRNISRFGPSYDISKLFWWGWIHRLEHIHTLVKKLKKRQADHWENTAVPLLTQAMNGKAKATLCTQINGEIQVIELERHKTTKQDVFLGVDCEKAYWFSWSIRRPDDGKELPSWAKPYVPTKLGQQVKLQIDYNGDLHRRVRVAERVMLFCITQRLEKISEHYKAGDLIQFKINDETFIFSRERAVSGWTYVGNSPKPVDVLNISPEFPKYF